MADEVLTETEEKPVKAEKSSVSFPNFDDVDLGIIAIGLIAMATAGLAAILLFKDKEASAAIAVIGMGITGISTLAGRKQKEGKNENAEK
jgi:hypothetical protein